MSTHPECRPKLEERNADEAADGVLLIAHGSRRPEANADLAQLAREVAARLPATVVEIAYLELAQPTVAEGARRCLQRGAKRVRLLPYFLSLGVHVTRDLEELRCSLANQYADVTFLLCPPLGLHPSIVDVVLHRLHQPSVDVTSPRAYESRLAGSGR